MIDWILKSTYILFTGDTAKSLKYRKTENKKMEKNSISKHLPKESWCSYITIDKTDFTLKSVIRNKDNYMIITKDSVNQE